MKIKKTLFSLLALGFVFCSQTNAKVFATDNLVKESLQTTADTHVVAGENGDYNYGANTTLRVQGRNTPDKNYHEVYIKFSVTEGVKKVESAELEFMYHAISTTAVGRTYTIYTTDTNWSEGSGKSTGVTVLEGDNSLTYNNASVYAATHGENYTTFEIIEEPVKGGLVSMDVTSIVNEYLKSNSDGNNITEISFRIVRDSLDRDNTLTFRSLNHTSGGAANLNIEYDLSDQESAVDIKSEIAKIDTMAMLDFGYTYTGSNTEGATAFNVPSTAADYVKENEDFSAAIGLDSELFNVTAMKNGATNAPRLYNSYTRMFANNSISVKMNDSNALINSITLTASASGLTVFNSSGIEIALNDEKYIINDNEFIVKNNTTTAINITSLTINYNISNIEYNSFSNVCMKFKATIPTAYLIDITSYGIKVNINGIEKDLTIDELKDEDNGKSFAVVISNITDYDTEITATAYVEIDSEIVYLKSKVHSVKTMVNEYISNSNKLELSSSQVHALNGFYDSMN